MKKKNTKHKTMRLPLLNSEKTATVDYEDYLWAKEYTWKLNDKGHVVAAEDDQFYLCNGVLAKARYGSPSYHYRFGKPL
jgi:hypothetical protein